MRPRTRLATLAGASLAVMLVAAACNSSSTAGTTSPTATPGATATPVATDTPGAQPTTTPAAPATLTLAATNNATLGAYLTGVDGMTLYIFTVDAPDKSNCSGTCATNWPPLLVDPGTTIVGPTGATGTFATITRSDGGTQVTYNHLPLYYYVKDAAAGDTTGQGVGGNWFIAKVAP